MLRCWGIIQVNDRLLRATLNGLTSFLAVADERSFTKAAARLGLTQAAVSQAVRSLEEAVGVLLVVRTSRSVSLTEAGVQLAADIAPRLARIDEGLSAVADMREDATGTVRITAPDDAIRFTLLPALEKFLQTQPGVTVELFSDTGFVDLAQGRFDAGVRLGETIAQDMIAVRISDEVRYALVAARSYLKGRAIPTSLEDLDAHNCINQRLATHGGLWAWELEKAGRKVEVSVRGQLIFNNVFDCYQASLAGHGLAYVPYSLAKPQLDAGKMTGVLEEWWATWPPFYLYYPSRRQPSKAMSLLVEALRVKD